MIEATGYTFLLFDFIALFIEVNVLEYSSYRGRLTKFKSAGQIV